MTRGTNTAHILVVDDDRAVRALLRECLELGGFVVSEAASSAEMTRVLDKGGVDLVTLDLMLGGENGLAVAASTKARYNLPIIMITGKGDIVDKVVGLEVGADDYIAKPFHPREVVARVRAVLRRGAVAAPVRAEPAEPRLTFDGWMLDPGGREVKNPDGAAVDLTTAEFELLETFARRPRRVLSRDAIMDALKGREWSPLDRSIDALISRLRHKIEADADKPRLIKTVRGVGYVFAADVRAT